MPHDAAASVALPAVVPPAVVPLAVLPPAVVPLAVVPPVVVVTDAAPDRVALRGLRVRGNHGVLPAERRDGQDFVVDAVLHLDTRPAALSDALADTVDYAALAHQLAAVVGGEPVDLVETLAQRLAEVCLADARVAVAEVTVHKPQAPVGLEVQDVAVTVRRVRG